MDHDPVEISESFLEQLQDTNYAEREHKVDGVRGSRQPWIIEGFAFINIL